MKKYAAITVLFILCGSFSAFGSLNVIKDETASTALLTWSRPENVQIGFLYSRMERTLENYGVLDSTLLDAQVGVDVFPWWRLYGRVGSSDAKIKMQRFSANHAVGGLLGTRFNVWQIDEGLQRTAWQFTVQLDASYAYRTTREDRSGSLTWSEAQVRLPLNYHLTLAKASRQQYLGDFHSLEMFVAPVYSYLDGTWKLNKSLKRDVKASEDFGVVFGLEFWLTERLSFSGEYLLLDKQVWTLGLRYQFP